MTDPDATPSQGNTGQGNAGDSGAGNGTAPVTPTADAPAQAGAGQAVETGTQGQAGEFTLKGVVPDHLHGHPALAGAKSREDVIKGIAGILNGIHAPVADPNGYELGSLPEGLTPNEAMTTGFKDAAHKLGLSNEQAKGLFEFYNQHTAGTVKATQEREAAAEKGLRSEWGQDYEPRMGLLRDTLKKYGGEKLFEELNLTRAGSNPNLIKALYGLVNEIGEDTIRRGDGPGGNKRPTGRDGKPLMSYPSMQKK